MPSVHPIVQRRCVGGQALKPDAEFLVLRQLPFEMVERGEGSLDLGTSGQPGLDGAPRESFGIRALAGGRPRDDHAASLASAARSPSQSRRLRRGKDFTLDAPPARRRAIRSFYQTMRDEYIKEAQKVIQDPNVLINVVSRRVKQLRRGSRPLVESLEKLSPEDIALREVIEGKISYEVTHA